MPPSTTSRPSRAAPPRTVREGRTSSYVFTVASHVSKSNPPVALKTPLTSNDAEQPQILTPNDAQHPFPPMEIVALPRPDQGTFLCAGAVATLGDPSDLRAATEHIGTALRRRFGYLGAFAVDGILTEDGFRPTDLNARLTSAMEAAPSLLRVRLHVANLLARGRVALDPACLQAVAAEVFAKRPNHILYGAATHVSGGSPKEVRVRWRGGRLVTANSGTAHGRLTIARSARGWLLTAALLVDQIPVDGPLGALVPDLFQLSDKVLGTDLGPVAPPFGAGRHV